MTFEDLAAFPGGAHGHVAQEIKDKVNGGRCGVCGG